MFRKSYKNNICLNKNFVCNSYESFLLYITPNMIKNYMLLDEKIQVVMLIHKLRVIFILIVLKYISVCICKVYVHYS